MKTKFNAAGIIGLGSCVPDKVLTNFDLEKMVDTSDEWIVKRTGISERRILDKSTPASHIGAEAARKAISNAGLTPLDIDMIIVTTETPDYLTPSMACMIQDQIGAGKCPAFDLNAACSGFIYGLVVARQFIITGSCRYVLVVGCEGLSRVVDWEDRSTCILFSDGAGAAVVGAVEEGYGIISTYIGADGSLGHNITIPCCYMNESDVEKRHHENKRVIWLDGGEVFKFAVKALEEATNRVLQDAGLTINDVDLLVPHQANARIIEGAAKRLEIDNESIYVNIHKYGNMSSASIPVALDEAMRNKMIKKGDILVLVGFGGGLTLGSVLLKWNIG